MNPSIVKQELSNKLEKLTSGTLLIEGPTLVGKTTLIENLKLSLEENSSTASYVRIFTCSQSHAGYEPILDTVEELSKRENWVGKRRMIGFARVYGLPLVRVIAGVVRSYFPDAIPKKTLENLQSSFDSVLNANKETATVPEFPRSDTSKLLKILGEVVKKSGRRLVLFVDRLEELPTPGIKLLQLLAESPLTNVVVVLSANSESTAYTRRKDIRELTNVCKKNSNSFVWEIKGYSAIELHELKQFNGYKSDMQSATKAYEYSDGGRIGLLVDWLNCDSDQGNMGLLKPAAGKLSAHYAIEYDRLEESCKSLIKCLGVVYPNGLDIYEVAACLECEVAELETRLHNVLGSFAVLSHDLVSLKNKHVLHCLHSRIAPALMQAAYDTLVAKLNGYGITNQTHVEPVQALLPKQTHKLSPSVINMDAYTLLHSAKEDLARGANQSAINRIEAWRKWQITGAQNTQIEAELILVEVDALGQLGIYDQAIEKLNHVPSIESVSLDASISLGEKYFRAGSYNLALDRLAYARRRSISENNIGAWLRATSRTLSIRNELMAGKGSVLLANCLDKYLANSGGGENARERGLAHRTLARTYSLIPSRQTSALIHAEKALEIAVNETKTQRDEGNARYALADTFRHRGQISEAISEYEKAKDIAAINGNYDLKLYALLGIAACHIKQCEAQRLNEILSELESVTINENSPEEKIVELFRFAQQKICNSGAISLDVTSAVSGRPWTYELVELLASPLGDVQNSFKQLLIVL